MLANDPAAKNQYFLDHYDEMNKLAEELGKSPLNHSKAYYQGQVQRTDSGLPQGSPSAVQDQVAWVGQRQAQEGSPEWQSAVNQLGALTDRHQKLFGNDVTGETPEQLADRMLLLSADNSQMKRYWATNNSGPIDAQHHIFEQYNQLKATDQLAAAKYLDAHKDELLSLGYVPKYPWPDVAALEQRQQHSDAAGKESAIWTQRDTIRAQQGPAAASAFVNQNRDQINALRAVQGKAPFGSTTSSSTPAATGAPTTTGAYSAPGASTAGTPTGSTGTRLRGGPPELEAANQAIDTAQKASTDFWKQFYTLRAQNPASARAFMDANRTQINSVRQVLGRTPLQANGTRGTSSTGGYSAPAGAGAGATPTPGATPIAGAAVPTDPSTGSFPWLPAPPPTAPAAGGGGYSGGGGGGGGGYPRRSSGGGGYRSSRGRAVPTPGGQRAPVQGHSANMRYLVPQLRAGMALEADRHGAWQPNPRLAGPGGALVETFRGAFEPNNQWK